MTTTPNITPTVINSIEGLGLTESDTYPNVKKIIYEPEPLRPTDIDIKILTCGICGADPHFVRGDWGGPHFPIIPGHEIIGIVVNKGSEVNDEIFKIGERIGVGAQADSCGNCYRCNHNFENNCRSSSLTYGNFHSMPKRQGGYASHIRVNSKFAFKIPDNISNEHAAPLLCGGMTSLSPLLVSGVKKDTNVAIVGIGGIGHMSIMFAKALGANITAISSSIKKKDLSLNLGAQNFISLDDPNFEEKTEDAFDVIVHTGSFLSSELASKLLKMLRPNGKLQIITGPTAGSTDLNLNLFELIGNNANIGGIASGSPNEIKYMLELASKHNIVPLIETIDINEDNIKTAWNRLDNNDVKFRFVLTGYDKFFK